MTASIRRCGERLRRSPVALDSAGFRPPVDGGSSTGGFPLAGGSSRPAPGGGAGPSLNLPPGTYGQRRDASGKVLGHVLITYGQAAPPAPLIPAHVPIGRLFSVGSVGSSGLRYRVYVIHDPEDSGLTLVAVPLHEVDQTLNQLLLVEVLVIAGVLVALGRAAFFIVRIGLRPLDRIGVTAGAIAAGDLSRRVTPADVAHGGRTPGAGAERDAWSAWSAPSPSARPAKIDCASSWRTPHMS